MEETAELSDFGAFLHKAVVSGVRRRFICLTGEEILEVSDTFD